MKSLKDVILSRNNLHFLPYVMVYGRHYRKIDLTSNARLFDRHSIEAIHSDVNQLGDIVADLKYLALARIFNCR